MKDIKITDIDFNLGFFQDAEGWYVDESGSEYHFRNGYLHSVDDLPAVKFKENNKFTELFWYSEGKIHRDWGLPAYESSSGELHWYQKGDLHRLKGPAIFKSEKSYEWYKNGVRHREDDDGPAYLDEKCECWYKNGFLSRLGGPAYSLIYTSENKKLRKKRLFYVNGSKIPKWMFESFPRNEEGKVHSLEPIMAISKGISFYFYALNGKIISRENIEKELLNLEFPQINNIKKIKV